MFDYIGVFHETTTRAAIIHILSTGSPNVGFRTDICFNYLCYCAVCMSVYNIIGVICLVSSP